MSKRMGVIAPMLLALAAALTAAGAAPKIDPRVLERARSEAAVAVFIVLEHQPQREILQRAESANALYREVAESRYRQAAERALTNPEELRQAREASEAVVLRTRQQAFQEIQQAVGTEQDGMESRLRGLGATHIARYVGINMIAAEIPASAIGALEADPEIAHVFAVEKQYPQLANSVPALGAPAFWSAGFTGQGESVGILDGGVRTNHPAFAGVAIISQVFLANGSTDPCFADDASSAQDEFGHGTHVAGIVASQGSAGWTNYQGVAKGLGTLYNLKIGYKLTVSSSCDPVGAESDSRDVLAALDWAVANTPLKIFNYSYGSPTTDDDDGFTQSIDQYIDNYGLTITIAAGNGGTSNYGVASPGIAYNSITVANAESYDTGTVNVTSSYGPTAGGRDKPDLAAPGTNIYSAAYNWDATPGTADDFVSGTGTSMAAPHIAGAAALLESAGVTNPLAVKAILLNTGKFGGWLWSNAAGWGFASLDSALSRLFYATGSLAAGGSQLYKLTAPADGLATLVWNRHVSGSTSSFNVFNLRCFDAHNGTEFYDASPQYTGQDVERVGVYNAGDYVLAVKMGSSPLAGVTSEPYALAAAGALTPVSGPKSSISCSMPSSLLAGSAFQATCDVTNSGDLSDPGMTGWFSLPAAFGGDTQILVGEVTPGSVYHAVLNLTAPAVEGTYTAVWSASNNGFFGLAPDGGAGRLTTTVSLALPAPVVVSPANGASGVPLAPALTWAAVAGATSYDVYFGTAWYPQLVTTTTQTSYSPGALVAGTMYCWRVVAKNGSGASSSPLVVFTTQAAPAGQEWYTITAGAPISSATSVAVDGSLNLYVAQGSGGLGVSKVAPDGTISSITGIRSGAIAADAAGNVYLAPSYEYIVYKIGPNGTVTTVAGTGVAGQLGDGGPATSAQLTFPEALTVDAAGNLYISDGPAVRKVSTSGTITTVAGDVWGTWGYSGDGGPGTSAQVSPGGLAVDASGSVYIADGSGRIRKVTPDGIINTVAGTGACSTSGDGGPAISADICMPRDVKLDAAGNLYIAESYKVRKVTSDGIIRTIAGGGSGWVDGGPALGASVSPIALAVDGTGKVYFADSQSGVGVLIPADPSCQYRLDQTALTVSGAGGTVPISIQTGPGCPWGVSGLPTWITTQTSGKGPATINLAVYSNIGLAQVATFAIAGIAVTITQADAPCSYAITSTPQTFPPEGGTSSVILTAPYNCPWTASNPAAGWATVASPLFGLGSAGFSVTVAPNPGRVRSTTMTVAGLPVTIRQAASTSTSLGFVPVTPCRVADTRGGSGAMGAAETHSFAIPQSGCGIPSTAQAYSLNVTVVPQGPLSYLSLWPTGQDKPLVSTLNSFGGIVVANAAMVPAGVDGAVSVFVTDPTDVILDINGYFDSPGNYAFYPVQPCRVADTRNPTGPFGGPALTGSQSRDFPVPSSSCGLPATASAYSMNVTVVPGGYLGYLKAWPTGQAQPNVSTLNSWTGKVVANAALIPAGTGGSISLYAEDATQVVLDTNGYFGAPGGTGALNFYPVTPCRVADTRGAAGPLGAPEMGDGETRSFPIPSSGCGTPSTAAAYSLNVTVVPDGMLQYLTAWPTGAGQPFASTLNSWDGAVVANSAIVPAGDGGAISVFVTNRTHVILDINGYFAP